MHRITVAIASLSLAMVAGCQKDDKSMEQALARIDKRLERMEKQLEKGGGAPAARGAAAAGAQARRRPPGPDPQAVYAVPIEGAPSIGPDNAKVTIVKAYEFACPFCDRVRPTLDQLMKDYPGDVRIVYKHLLVHPGTATIPAQAACAAHLQGKFKEMYEGIWVKGFREGRQLGKDKMMEIAKGIGLDAGKFEKDMEGDQCKKIVASDQQDLRKVGARGTPAFFINGRFLSGARPVDQFKKIVDEELKKADERLKKGAKQATYYDEWVVKKGKKSL